MDTSHRDMEKHVRSAKNWLEKAEQSFGEQSDIKGELNLMLAEAEMKNLRNHHDRGRKLRQIGAACLALFIALGVWGTAHILRDESSVVPVLQADRGTPPKDILTSPEWIPVPALQYTEKNQEPQAAQRESEAVQTPTSHQSSELVHGESAAFTAETKNTWTQKTADISEASPSSPPVMTTKQMQEVVQDARHSLRGKY